MPTVRVERVLHVRDLKLLLAGGVIHTRSPMLHRSRKQGEFQSGEVVTAIRLCLDTALEVERIMREARMFGQVVTAMVSCHGLPDFLEVRPNPRRP